MGSNISGAFELEALPQLDTVYRVALRLARDPVQAEDLVQDTMLKAYRAWDQYQSGTNVRSWLLTILRNELFSGWRRRRPEVWAVEFEKIEGTTVFGEVEETNPEGRFFHEQVDNEVVRAIDALPTEFRETLVLRDVEGLGYAEIGQVVGVRVGTVKSRIFRGRQILRHQLYDYAVQMEYIQPSAV